MLQRRNSRRLVGYDYSNAGRYFITIVTKHRAKIFGRIVGGRIELSEAGKIVETCWRSIPEHAPGTHVDVFQVMPNHVHGIIELEDPVLSAARRGVRPGALQGSVRAFDRTPRRAPGEARTPGRVPGRTHTPPSPRNPAH